MPHIPRIRILCDVHVEYEKLAVHEAAIGLHDARLPVPNGFDF